MTGAEARNSLDPRYPALHDIELSTVEVTKIAQTEFDIPIRSHPLVDHYLTLFQGRGRRFFQRWLDKSEIFIPIMAPILASYDLPADIVYLAMIESGYSGTATSPAAAAGFGSLCPRPGDNTVCDRTTTSMNDVTSS